MKYKKIYSDNQYNTYCEVHEELTYGGRKEDQDEIELLEILIDEYEQRKIDFSEKMNPVQILAYLMKENNLSGADIAADLGVSRQLISDVLRYRRRISRSLATKLAKRFNLNTEALNADYQLKSSLKVKASSSS